MSKLIGISSDVYLGATSIINQRLMNFIPHSTIDGVIFAGGIPVGLPNVPKESVNGLLERLDGIIVPGGPDVDPNFMGEEPIPELGITNRSRDIFEIALVRTAVAKHIPILGICRGAQIIDVALGGSLYQDLKAQYPGKVLKHNQEAPGNQPTHFVSVIHNSALFKSIGDNVFVNSRHHQAIKSVPSDLRIVAKASDGVIEAIESDDASVQAVQWHPENMWEDDSKQLALFKDFIDRT
ncbi:gamma-glutamyl-gamma-aminobutyrate hydrolase family protein [Companilactobacillus nuruki]|uniref:Gamma-glutamyl-gamma-aminobutyrate hydrolase n=1 Tax=Companilactobacillus nuruki TaxID=1993540 RepID=A0A2N7AVZ7_9LACO|nr:gamma-glutamyl-gamma-aminobutyrate hydrolase family protein [Companilactobacillus nuruki]PMD72475.1 gamma-glutamyl-gamma-aminobutyrate hydrolase [Companilactobacillus nuruki]